MTSSTRDVCSQSQRRRVGGRVKPGHDGVATEGALPRSRVLARRRVEGRFKSPASWPGLTRPSTPSRHAGGWRFNAPYAYIILMLGGWVYIMTNRPNGTLYTGVTNNIARRAFEHRAALVEGFTKRYGLKRLVYMERYEDIANAIQRERNMKHWPRAWKVRLILETNPGWRDLYDQLNA
jgi:putative endonuclease